MSLSMMTPAVIWNTLWKQTWWIQSPSVTEKNCPDQTGRIHLITGGNTGVGFELCKILYGANAIVYLTSRDSSKGYTAIDRIKSAVPNSKGRIELLELDLADLSNVKRAAEEFRSRESKLHYLCNNAGLMMPEKGMATTQGHNIEMGTNCIGPYLLTRLLTPLLRQTAKEERAKGVENSVRVSWAGSLMIDSGSPSGAVQYDAEGIPKIFSNKITNYGQSKAGNLLLANAFAKDLEGDGVVSVCFNPGNLHSDLTRHLPWYEEAIIRLIFYPAICGAYTELYCGVSSDLTTQDNGRYIAPWGQKSWNRRDVEEAVKAGASEKFADYCFHETKGYM